ncbi:hypothetical protein SAMN05216388_100912 [Halorientalis persicus]|uniref:Type IV secretion system protein TrbL n=1 Tax=Halorientalis persicus TaxID=1367881 RepID=A0A1H8MIQ8_9EURY|nr:hypothetical protein [Halorientalis persicus]SEO17199.1 hypothetical protein SAMN05216388_100912 [Halorientalis persicus]
MGLLDVVTKGITGAIEAIVNGIGTVLGNAISTVIDFVTYVPKPQVDNGYVIGEPTNGVWQVIYQSRWGQDPHLIPLGLLILVGSWYARKAGEPWGLFSNYDKKKAANGLITGVIAMWASWWAFGYLLHFSSEITSYLLISSAEWSNLFSNNFGQVVSGSAFAGLIVGVVGVGLLLLVVILHVLRIFGVYFLMYALPILVACYFGGVPVAKGISKKAFKYLFIFATIPIPTALGVSLTATFLSSDSYSIGESAVTSTIVEPMVLTLPLLVGFVVPIFMMSSISSIASIGALNQAASTVSDPQHNRVAAKASAAKGAAASKAKGTAVGAGSAAKGAVGKSANVAARPEDNFDAAKERMDNVDVGGAVKGKATDVADKAHWKASQKAGSIKETGSQYKSLASRGKSYGEEAIDNDPFESVPPENSLPEGEGRKQLPSADYPASDGPEWNEASVRDRITKGNAQDTLSRTGTHDVPDAGRSTPDETLDTGEYQATENEIRQPDDMGRDGPARLDDGDDPDGPPPGGGGAMKDSDTGSPNTADGSPDTSGGSHPLQDFSPNNSSPPSKDGSSSNDGDGGGTEWLTDIADPNDSTDNEGS